MSNNTSGKIELNITPQFVEELEKIVTSHQLGFENVEGFILEATRLYAQKFGADDSKIAIPMQQIAISQAIVSTLETVWDQVNSKEEPSELKNAIAGDLLKAEVALEIAKNGKIEPEKVKELALELF